MGCSASQLEYLRTETNRERPNRSTFFQNRICRRRYPPPSGPSHLYRKHIVRPPDGSLSRGSVGLLAKSKMLKAARERRSPRASPFQARINLPGGSISVPFRRQI